MAQPSSSSSSNPPSSSPPYRAGPGAHPASTLGRGLKLSLRARLAFFAILCGSGARAPLPARTCAAGALTCLTPPRTFGGARPCPNAACCERIPVAVGLGNVDPADALTGKGITIFDVPEGKGGTGGILFADASPNLCLLFDSDPELLGAERLEPALAGREVSAARLF